MKTSIDSNILKVVPAKKKKKNERIRIEIERN